MILIQKLDKNFNAFLHSVLLAFLILIKRKYKIYHKFISFVLEIPK